MLPLPLDAVIVLGEDEFRGTVSLTLPLPVFAVTSYWAGPGGRTSVMLPLLLFTRTSRGTLVNTIWMSPLPVEAVIAAVAMLDPLMLPLLVFAVIVVDATPSALMLPSPDEAESVADLMAFT
jgi:hypothetical protein